MRDTSYFSWRKVVLSTKDLHVYYGADRVHSKGVDIRFENDYNWSVLPRIRKINLQPVEDRMNDTIDGLHVTGEETWYEGIDVNRPDINVYDTNTHIGMVFQRPNHFAKSIYRNITFRMNIRGWKNKGLRWVVKLLWNSSLGSGQDDHYKSALTLRWPAATTNHAGHLCRAWYLTLWMKPIGSDPSATAQFWRNHAWLKKNCTIVARDPSIQQTRVLSDYRFLLLTWKPYQYE